MYTLKPAAPHIYWKESSPESEGSISGYIRNAGNSIAESDLGSKLGKKIITLGDSEKESLIDATEAAIKALKQKSPEYYRFLIETEAISENRVSLAKRWLDGSGAGESGAKALLVAIESYNRTHIPIVLSYSNKAYSTTSLSSYESTIRQSPDKFNSNALGQGLLRLAMSGDTIFSDETWGAVGAYCEKRGWNSSIIGGNQKVKEFLEKKYLAYEEQKSHVLEATKWAEWQRQFKEDPRFAEFLRQKSYILPNGRIDVKKAIDTFPDKSPNGIITGFNTLASTLSTELASITKMIQEKESRLKEVGANTLKELCEGARLPLPEIPARLLSTFPKGWRREDIKTYLKVIVDYRNANTKDPTVTAHLNTFIDILIAQGQSLEKRAQAEEAKRRKLQAESSVKSGAKTTEDVVTYLTAKPQEDEASIVSSTALVRAELMTSTAILEERYEIKSYDEAQKKLHELDQKERSGTLTEADRSLQYMLRQNYQIRSDQAILYRSSIATVGETKAQELFLETNRGVSRNPKEQYDFARLEKAGVLLDPESTPGDRALANLVPGETITLSRLIEGGSTVNISTDPSLRDLSVKMNDDGSYSVPLLSTRPLSKNELIELKGNIITFARLGLSQFVPHMPTLLSLMRQDGINVALDGHTDTTEEQRVLKYLYKNLFGSSLITNNLSEVEHAFSLALGSPTNLHDSLQGVLSRHGLISDSGRAISPDRLRSWIEGNVEATPEKMLEGMG